MPAARNPKPTKTSPKSTWHRRSFWAVAVLLFLAGGGFAASKYLDYQNTKAIAEERARFKQADRDIQKIAEAIVATVGPPIKTEESKSCTRPSAKFTEAPLSCSVGKTLFFEISTSEQANILYKQAAAKVSHDWSFKNVTMSNNMHNQMNFTPIPMVGYGESMDYQKMVYTYFAETSTMQCNTSNIFYKSSSPPFGNYVGSLKMPYVLAFGIDCGNSAMAQYYKLRD